MRISINLRQIAPVGRNLPGVFETWYRDRAGGRSITIQYTSG